MDDYPQIWGLEAVFIGKAAASEDEDDIPSFSIQQRNKHAIHQAKNKSKYMPSHSHDSEAETWVETNVLFNYNNSLPSPSS